MSLNKIGKLQSTIKNAQITDGLISTLKNMDIKMAAPALKFTSLSADKKYTAMVQAYGADAAKNNAVAAGVYAVSRASEEATSSVSGLSAVFTGLFSVVKSLLPVLIPVASIIGGKMLFDTLNDKYTITKGMATKHYNQAVETYDTDKSDLESLTSEYNSNKERIYELREKENKSQSENLELSQLQSQNEMLHTQVTAKETLVKLDKKRKQETAKADLEHSVGSILDESNPDQPVPKSIDEIDEITNSINNQAEGLKTLIDKKNKLIQENKKLEEQGDTSSKKYLDNASDITDLDSDITQKQSSISEAIGKVNKKAEDLYNDDGTIDDAYKALAERVQNLNDEFLKLTDTSNADDKINNIFALSDYADLQDKLTEIGKKSGSKGIKNALEDNNTYSNLLSALDNKNVSLEDLTDYIMSIADPDAKNIEGIKENLKDEFSYNKKLNDFFKDKSDKDIEGFWDYYQNQGFDAEEYNWKQKDLSDNWDEYIESTKTAATESATFASKFKNSAEDTATDIDTVTDNFQSDMSNIKSAMDSLKSGDMQNSDLTDLIQQFPELAGETDNLQQGLQNLALDKAATAIGKIRDSVKDTTDPKELAQADRYIQSIMDGINTAEFELSAGENHFFFIDLRFELDCLFSNSSGDITSKYISPLCSAELSLPR